MAYTHATSINKFGVTPLIVATSSANGSHTTLAAALADAVSGDTIFLRDSITEDVTLVAGVNITSWLGSEQTPTVSITGKLSFASAGTVDISCIRLTTNSDNFLAVTGSAASIVYLNNCYLNCLNATGISFTTSNTSAFIRLKGCDGNLGTTGIGLYSMSSTGTLNIQFSTMSNTGASVTASSNSEGLVQLSKSSMNIPFSTSSAGAINIFAGNSITTSATNTECLIMAGTGTGRSELSLYDSGTASAISIGVGCTYTISSCEISSSNTNPITGAGTINYGGLTFPGTSNINTTTKNVSREGPSRTIGSANSGAANVLTVNNTSNTATSSAQVAISTAGATADDPTLLLTTTTTSWIVGVDNSVTVPTADPFVISQGSALGTNNIMSVATNGEINYPLQPSFLATANLQSDVTGDGTAYTVIFANEIFDQNGDFSSTTFTAPVTGRYQINFSMEISGLGVVNTTGNIQIVTSNRTVVTNTWNYGVVMNISTIVRCVGGILIDIDKDDICTIVVQIQNGTKVVDIIATNSTFSGFLQA